MKYRYYRSYFNCRWSKKKFYRSDNWIIFGVQQRWVSTDTFLLTLGLFGFDWTIWFKEKNS